MCAADGYWCTYYCEYSNSWYYNQVMRKQKECPLQSGQVDPFNPPAVFPSWQIQPGGNPGGRKLRGEKA